MAEVEVSAGDLPGLENGETSGGPSPLDVLGESVVILDALTDRAQLANKVVRERLDESQVGGDRDGRRALAGRVRDGLHLLVCDPTIDDLERLLGDDELIGVDVAGHDRLAEAPAGVEEELERV